MKNKKVLYIAIPVVVVIALLALFVSGFGPGGNRSASAKEDSKLGEYLPVDSDTVVITPSDPDWWKTVSSFAPAAFALKKSTPDESLQVSYLGYSRSPNHQETVLAGTGPLQLVYLESPSEADAEKVFTWLSDDVATASKGMAVKRIENVNVLSFNWAIPELKKPSDPISGDPLFTDEVPLIWMNYDKIEETIQSTASTGKGEAAQLEKDQVVASESPDVLSLMRTSMGITEGTVWRATSEDGGKTWGGKFVAGGIDPARIDPKKAQKLVEESSQVMVDYKGEGTSAAKMRVMTPGLIPLQAAFALKYADRDDTFGGAQYPDGGLEGVPGEIVSGSSPLGTQAMDMASSGSGVSPTGIDSSQISASETEMKVRFDSSGAADSLYNQ